MMKIQSLAAVAALTCVSFFSLSAAWAQNDAPPGRDRDRGGRGGPGGGGSWGPGGGMVQSVDSLMGRLVGVEKVQVELEVMADQKAALQKLADMPQPERPNFDFRTASDEVRIKAFEKMAADSAKRAAETKEQLAEILLPPQFERLEQIALQAQGSAGLATPELAAKLSLTAEQTAKVKAEMAGFGEKMREAFSSGNREGMREKFAEMRKIQDANLLAVLTDAQKSEYEKRKGKPFEIDMAALGGGRGGFGGGFGGGGPDRAPGGDGARRARPEAE